MKNAYRIQTADGRIKYAGTDAASWFPLDVARRLVDYDADERIIESDGANILWEVL